MLEDGPLYLREGSGLTKLLPETEGGGASFQIAAANGTIAFFINGGTLFRYGSESEASTAIATGVKGVLGASADGSYVYYQDASGLEQWHDGTTTTIAPGADAAAPEDYPPESGSSRVSADGSSVAFLSIAELTPYENVDANSGNRDTELYLFREAPGADSGTLICASCNPTGERPLGSASVPGAYANGSTRIYKPRVLARDGSRLFFDSADRLSIADSDGLPDVYEWEATGTGDCTQAAGCISLISQARTEGATFLDASASGDDVFFLTGESSVGVDPGSVDVYDARVGGGLPESPRPFVCTGDACQALPSPPDDPTPGTLVPNGGNPPQQITKPKPRKHKHRHHKHKHKNRSGRR